MRRGNGVGGGRPRRVTVRDVAILTSPLLLGLLYAAGAAVLDFRTAYQFDDWWSHRQTFESLFEGRLLAAERLPGAMSARLAMDAEAHDPQVIRVSVPADEWETQVADPFLGDPGWIAATVVREGRLQDAEVRRRGDTSVHWTTPKVSFTLQVPRGEHVRGFRELALIGKEVLSADVANTIPAELGVLAPFTAVVPVYVNERFYGLFRAAEPIDESFLHHTRRMPGNVFRAEAAERGEYYKNVPRNVWVNPYIWDRVAENDVAGVDSFAALHELLDAVNGTRFEDHRRLMGLVDRESLARLLASTLIVGDPYHMSGVHNQFWYEDPTTGTLYEIPWDLRLLDLRQPPAPGRLNDFFRAVLRDPFLIDQILRRVHEAAEGGLYSRIEARVHAVVERFGPYLEYEHARRELVSDPGDPEAILRQLRANLATLDEWIGDAGIRFAAAEGAGGTIVDFETTGWTGADLIALRLPAGGTAAVSAWIDRDGDGRRGPADPEAPSRLERTPAGARLVFEPPLALLPAWDTEGPGLRPGRRHYRLFVTGAGSSPELAPDLHNRITGDRIAAEPVAAGTPLGGSEGWSPWRFETPPPGRTVRLEGRVQLSESLHLSERDQLVIAAGTSIELEPDVSIVSRGRVTAVGTAARPIRFSPSAPGTPWGSLVLLGSGADGSRFEHATFAGGGSARLGRIQFEGMVTVHRARGVVFRDVLLEDNLRSDDALSAVNSDVTLERCVVRRANADAIDLSYSTGTITGCLIEDARNDAIDLMASSPLIASNRLLRSGDNGISIGEASHPLVVDSHIAGGTGGIEVRERSRPVLLHTTIERNDVGLLLAAGNWRYMGAGWTRIYYSRVTGNASDLDVDGPSLFSTYESQVGEAPLEPAEGSPPWWIHAAQGLDGRTQRPGA
ncbi:MAG: CotH kinase family protein, partial [Gemmatimonadota bacterium]